jgi:hypothetical protein
MLCDESIIMANQIYAHRKKKEQSIAPKKKKEQSIAPKPPLKL